MKLKLQVRPELIGLAVALAVTGAMLFVSAEEVSGSSKLTKVTPPPLLDVRPELIGALTLGHRHAYQHMLTVWLAQVFAFEDLTPADGPVVADLVRKVLVHKPDLEVFYTHSCFFLAKTLGMPSECLKVTAVGMAQFPQSWLIPLSQAYVFHLILRKPDKAASFYALAAASPRCPDYVAVAARTLAKSDGLDQESERAIELLRTATIGTDSEQFFNKEAP